MSRGVINAANQAAMHTASQWHPRLRGLLSIAAYLILGLFIVIYSRA